LSARFFFFFPIGRFSLRARLLSRLGLGFRRGRGARFGEEEERALEGETGRDGTAAPVCLASWGVLDQSVPESEGCCANIPCWFRTLTCGAG
jgi:hypothetical protein